MLPKLDARLKKRNAKDRMVMSVRSTLSNQIDRVPANTYQSRALQDSPRYAASEDWKFCSDVSRNHGKSFFLASRLLPPNRRKAILAAYAFCRIADDIVDAATSSNTTQTLDRLDDWERQLSSPNHPVSRAFAAARDQFQIPDQPVHDLCAGLRSDLDNVRFSDWSELREYCYLVAGTVGLIVAPILGCRDDRALKHAADLGIAMQLTNILRDVKEDAAMGRIYLPLDELNAYQIDPDDILKGNPGEAFPDFVAFQIRRARDLYSSAMTGVPALVPSGQLATLAAAELYSGILGEIEAMNFDVFAGRAHLSPAQKIIRFARALSRFATPSGGYFPNEEPDQLTETPIEQLA
jgi:15-cis-phytoene synthase